MSRAVTARHVAAKRDMQPRIYPDVAKLVVAAVEENSRTVPAEVNHALRVYYDFIMGPNVPVRTIVKGKKK